jgi:hypothetical protein
MLERPPGVSPPDRVPGASKEVPLRSPGEIHHHLGSPDVLQTPAKVEPESSSSLGDEDPPTELIWCDESAFRDTATEKKAELEALGIRVRGFKSADKCVRSLTKRIEVKKQKGGTQAKTIALVTERNSTLIPYLTSRMDEIQLQCIVVVLHQATNKKRYELTFGSVPAIRAVASTWQEAVEVMATIVAEMKALEMRAQPALQ